MSNLNYVRTYRPVKPEVRAIQWDGDIQKIGKFLTPDIGYSGETFRMLFLTGDVLTIQQNKGVTEVKALPGDFVFIDSDNVVSVMSRLDFLTMYEEVNS